MANGFGSLYVGASGLQNSQYALNTTANNLANVNTKGYVREQVRFADKSYNKLRDPRANINMQQSGLGVSIGDVVHARDIFLDKSFRQESGRKEFYSARYETASYVQDLMQELHGEQFKESIGDLWQAVQEVSTKMDESVYQNLVFEKADLFVSRTNALYSDMKSYQSNINEQIKDDIDRVNEIGDRIYELNLQIQSVEAANIETAMTLRDERDLLLDELGGYGSVNVKEDATGFTFVDFESTRFIDLNKCYNVALQEDRDTGFYTPYWPHLSDTGKGQYVKVFHLDEQISTDLNTDVGGIKSKLLVRGDTYGTYENMQDQEAYDKIAGCTMMETEAEIDLLFHSIVTAMNDIYCPNKAAGSIAGENGIVGTDREGNAVTITKDTLILDTENCARGVDMELPPRELFTRIGMERYKTVTVTGDDGKQSTYYVYNQEDPDNIDSRYGIGNVRVNEELRKQITLMPTYRENGTTDYAMGAKLTAAWDKQEMKLNPYDEEPCAFEGYYTKMVGKLANEGNTYQTAAEALDNAVESIDNQRQQAMGVSSDEELTHMIKFQSAYNASSRFMTVISEMTELIVTGLI